MIREASTYLAAGRHFRKILSQVPPDAWDKPGLGHWDVRTLAGHTSRSLVTVMMYLNRTAQQIDVASPCAYFFAFDSMSSPDITERAVQAARELGGEPLAAVDRILASLEEVLPAVEDRVILTLAGGIRLSDYLPTRTFELAVHSLDLAAACGISSVLPADVELSAIKLAVEIASARGDGSILLRGLTGRGVLPSGYSVV